MGRSPPGRIHADANTSGPGFDRAPAVSAFLAAHEALPTWAAEPVHGVGSTPGATPAPTALPPPGRWEAAA